MDSETKIDFICSCREGQNVESFIPQMSQDMLEVGLEEACMHGTLDTVQLLFPHVTNFKAPEVSVADWCFFLACKYGQMNVMYHFLTQHNVTAYNAGLRAAATGNNDAIVDLLIDDYGAADLDRALSLACTSGHYSMCDKLLARGATMCRNCNSNESHTTDAHKKKINTMTGPARVDC